MDGKERSSPNAWIAIAISLLAFLTASVISSTTLYFTHFYTSETLYAILLDFTPDQEIADSEMKGMRAEVVLVNSGNQNVVVTKLSFGVLQDLVHVSECPAMLVEPRQARQFQVRLPFDVLPRYSWQREAETRDYPIRLEFTTVGSSGHIQEGEIPVGTLYLKDGKYWNHGKDDAELIEVRN
jgi:hypothetical protein